MARKAKKRATISDQIRQVIESSGLSRYEICKQAGIDQAAMSRFMSGERGLSTSTLDKLADVLGLEIVTRKGR
jgi:transcriptional regulator with XRE-family HTH domain